MGISMKVHHQYARGFIWDHHQNEPSSLTLAAVGCKRLRPLAPKILLPPSDDVLSPIDLKSFIRPDTASPRNLLPASSPSSSSSDRREPSSSSSTHNQVEITQPGGGGTRWNPTQEQIGILEMLYRGGMRTPNAQQIEQITAQLGKYGKIEGKNVFYWFQNHKARERQKQKRISLGLTHSPRTPPPAFITATPPPTSITLDLRGEILLLEKEKEEDGPYKRKCRGWPFEYLEDNGKMYYYCNEEEEAGDGTLELFPLHPEARS